MSVTSPLGWLGCVTGTPSIAWEGGPSGRQGSPGRGGCLLGCAPPGAPRHRNGQPTGRQEGPPECGPGLGLCVRRPPGLLEGLLAPPRLGPPLPSSQPSVVLTSQDRAKLGRTVKRRATPPCADGPALWPPCRPASLCRAEVCVHSTEPAARLPVDMAVAPRPVREDAPV